MTPKWLLATPEWHHRTLELYRAIPEWNKGTIKWHRVIPEWHLATPEWHQVTPKWHQVTLDWHQTTPEWHQATPAVWITAHVSAQLNVSSPGFTWHLCITLSTSASNKTIKLLGNRYYHISIFLDRCDQLSTDVYSGWHWKSPREMKYSTNITFMISIKIPFDFL